jgi:hypothetical protein
MASQREQRSSSSSSTTSELDKNDTHSSS